MDSFFKLNLSEMTDEFSLGQKAIPDSSAFQNNFVSNNFRKISNTFDKESSNMNPNFKYLNNLPCMSSAMNGNKVWKNDESKANFPLDFCIREQAKFHHLRVETELIRIDKNFNSWQKLPDKKMDFMELNGRRCFKKIAADRLNKRCFKEVKLEDQTRKKKLKQVKNINLTDYSAKSTSRCIRQKSRQQKLIRSFGIESFHLLFSPFSESLVEKINKNLKCNKMGKHEKKIVKNLCTRSNVKSLKLLQNLFSLMETILNGKKLNRNAIDGLNWPEKFILEKILAKKMYNGIDYYLKKLKSKKTVEITVKNQIVSVKRKEESLKFVFRLIIKELQKSFFQESRAGSEARGDLNDRFYLHHFENFISAGLTTLSELKTPYFKMKGQSGRNKTLNKVFLTQLNLSEDFANKFNTCLLEIICLIIPFFVHKKKCKRISKISKNIIQSIQHSSRVELFKKMQNWEIKLKSKNGEGEETRICEEIGKEISDKVFKFPWTVWEAKNAFVMTLLSFNEFSLASKNQIERSSSGRAKIDSLETNSSIKKKLSTSKQKEIYIKNQLNEIKKFDNKLYWMGIINRNVKDYQDFISVDKELGKILSKEEFLEEIRLLGNPRKASARLQLHICQIIFNMLINSNIKNKDLKSTSEENKILLFEYFLTHCSTIFEKLNCPSKGKEKAFLKNCLFLENFFNRILNKKNHLLLRIVPTIKFISQMKSLLAGIKNKNMLKSICVYLDSNLKLKICNLNLLFLLKILLIRK